MRLASMSAKASGSRPSLPWWSALRRPGTSPKRFLQASVRSSWECILTRAGRENGVRLLGLPGEHQRVPAREADRAARDKALDGKPQRIGGGVEAYLCGNALGCPEAGGIGHDDAGAAGLETRAGGSHHGWAGAGQGHGAQEAGLH